MKIDYLEEYASNKCFYWIETEKQADAFTSFAKKIKLNWRSGEPIELVNVGKPICIFADGNSRFAYMVCFWHPDYGYKIRCAIAANEE
tara:strand:+ start:26305 stop:26568 length:264 start_codon:yes stop_codon:yes gene_type:complete